MERGGAAWKAWWRNTNGFGSFDTLIPLSADCDDPVAGHAGGTKDNAAGRAGPDLNQRLLHRQSFLTVPQQNKAPT
jgi:hypothetical protein